MNVILGDILYAVVQMVGNKSKGEGLAFSSEKIDLKETKEFLFNLFDKSIRKSVV